MMNDPTFQTNKSIDKYKLSTMVKKSLIEEGGMNLHLS